MVVYTDAAAETTNTPSRVTTTTTGKYNHFVFTQSTKCELFTGKRLSTVLNSHSAQMSPPVGEEEKPNTNTYIITLLEWLFTRMQQQKQHSHHQE
jgi:hypothetical protein